MKPAEPDSLVRLTQEVWGKHYPEPVSHEDAREIAQNMVGLFGLLQKWDCASKVSPIGHRQAGTSQSKVGLDSDSRPKSKSDRRPKKKCVIKLAAR